MYVVYEPVFLEQVARYSFCFTCEQCVHFDGDDQRCAHEFPNSMHRLARYQNIPAPKEIIFCKEFELI